MVELTGFPRAACVCFIFGAFPHNSALQRTAGKLRLPVPSAHRAPAAAELRRYVFGNPVTMARRHLDPRITNIFLDSCAFDPKYSPEDEAALSLFRRHENGSLMLQIAHSTQKEIDHPNTPSWVKREAISLIYTIETSLTDSERKLKAQILKTLAGNGRSENVSQDAQHVFEAAKYGSYFVTTDERILKNKRTLCSLCNVDVVKPSELTGILKTYENA